MKIEDLRLNDLVLFNGVAIRVNSIDGDLGAINIEYTKYGEISNRISIEDISPIPLTPEILERNNFQSKEDQHSHRKIFFLGKNEYNLDVYFNNGTIILVEEKYEPGIYVYVCDCEYVHKLQHTLRDLEIEKEIVL